MYHSKVYGKFTIESNEEMYLRRKKSSVKRVAYTLINYKESCDESMSFGMVKVFFRKS